jgi:DNA-directed RNA polymerase specialized sigma subunit
MTSKEYLRQAYRLNELIDSDAEELERLRDLSFKIAGGNYGERLISSGRKEPSFVRYIDEIDEMERKIHAELCELVLLKRNITQAINRMENREERLVLTYRYLSNKTWEQISSILSVSIRTVHRIHQSALNHFSVPS